MYCVVDIESSGSKYQEEAIIEIAIYRFDGKEIVDQFISMINPEQKIDSFVEKLTGITNKMVKTAPKFHEVAKRVIEITEDSILVGHNVVYDYKMLRNSFKKLGYDFYIDTIDTLPIARRLVPNYPSYSLGKLCESLKIPLTDRHRASGDAKATLSLFKILLEKDSSKEIIKKFTNKESEFNSFKQFDNLINNLPSKKGVFYFFNRKGDIVYIEKSKNIRVKVQRILYGNTPRYKLIQQHTKRIEYELTATDLITTIKHKNEIAKNQPLFNSKIKNKSYIFGVFQNEENVFINKIKEIQELPLVKYKTLMEANSALMYLENNKIPTIASSFLLIDAGRNSSEKSFVAVKKETVIGYGFYQVYKQIENWEKITSTMTSIDITQETLFEDLKGYIFRGKYKAINKV
ncbi:MAG: 3'-5' exonuclease [Flavobacteriales bacterium]|nr:3'-5' exonuclease [Flavobacteriales bacterium]